MSQLSLKKIKLGDNADLSKNFVISVPAVADGTLTIERENGTDVLTIDESGGININSPWKSYTPKLFGSTTTGVGTYTSQIGFYIDFGAFVFIQGRVDWTAHTGTGFMRVTLPIPADETLPVPFSTYMSGVNVGTDNAPLLMIAASGTALQVYGLSNVSGGAANVPTMDTAGTIIFSGYYRKA